MKTENLLPPDEPRTKECWYCNGLAYLHGERCSVCKGTGEIIEEDPRYYFDELKADDEDRGKHSNQLNQEK